MNHKLQILKHDLKEPGIFYALKKVILYLLRPIANLMKRSVFLINLRYGTIPDLQQKIPFYRSDSKMIKLPQSELVKEGVNSGTQTRPVISILMEKKLAGKIFLLTEDQIQDLLVQFVKNVNGYLE